MQPFLEGLPLRTNPSFEAQYNLKMQNYLSDHLSSHPVASSIKLEAKSYKHEIQASSYGKKTRGGELNRECVGISTKPH